MSRIDTAYIIYNKQSSTSIDCWSQIAGLSPLRYSGLRLIGSESAVL